jgi:hypothetical protein
MMRAARFSQADISRALRAAKKVGDDYCVEVEPGGLIRIVRGGPTPSSAAPRPLAIPRRKPIIM